MNTIDSLYNFALFSPFSDIAEHLETLRDYASKCDDIAEFGVRTGISTIGLLMGHPKKMTSYDYHNFPYVREYLEAAQLAGINFTFKEQDDCLELIEPVDFLFIDSEHTYEQTHRELQMHSEQVRKWIGFHDTFWELSTQLVEGPSWPLWRAINELLDTSKWHVILNRLNCNGLTIIERK